MSRIDGIFNELRARNAKAIMPFVCGGYPAPGALSTLLPALERGGASVVEVGVPFSDPVADGPTIAAAMHDALGSGCTPRTVFEEIESVRSSLRVGIVTMVSVSIVHRMGAGMFIQQAKDAGVDGFIFPDLPVEESRKLVGLVRDHGLTVSLLVAPTTTPERMETVVKACSGFVYLLARAGITGTGSEVPDISPRVKLLRGMTDLPIACGFGVSSAAHVRRVVHDGGADAAIVGSAMVKRISEAVASNQSIAQAAESFTVDLAAGLWPNEHGRQMPG